MEPGLEAEIKESWVQSLLKEAREHWKEERTEQELEQGMKAIGGLEASKLKMRIW